MDVLLTNVAYDIAIGVSIYKHTEDQWATYR